MITGRIQLVQFPHLVVRVVDAVERDVGVPRVGHRRRRRRRGGGGAVVAGRRRALDPHAEQPLGEREEAVEHGGQREVRPQLLLLKLVQRLALALEERKRAFTPGERAEMTRASARATNPRWSV